MEEDVEATVKRMFEAWTATRGFVPASVAVLAVAREGWAPAEAAQHAVTEARIPAGVVPIADVLKIVDEMTRFWATVPVNVPHLKQRLLAMAPHAEPSATPRFDNGVDEVIKFADEHLNAPQPHQEDTK